ncbi:hypothetical protein K488DRAFT_13111, partial [Vararia minispora EC-137]
SSNDYAFMAIVIQWVNDDWEIEELLLDFQEIASEHSGENLRKILWNTIEYYELR